MTDRAYVFCDSARIILEPRIFAPVCPPYLHGYLAMAYAELGRKSEAIREGKLRVELLPISRDALSGPYHLEILSEIYVRFGEYDLALHHLEQLLAIPSRVTPVTLRLDPIWDPLRDDPRFMKLLAKPSV